MFTRRVIFILASAQGQIEGRTNHLYAMLTLRRDERDDDAIG